MGPGGEATGLLGVGMAGEVSGMEVPTNYPNRGCVMVLPVRSSRVRIDNWWDSPNKGWTWMLCDVFDHRPDVTYGWLTSLYGRVFPHRKEAMKDAERVFPTIKGWCQKDQPWLTRYVAVVE